MTIDSHCECRIRQNLACLYGETAAKAAWVQLRILLEGFLDRNPGGSASFPRPFPDLTEKDAFLITYGDTFQEPGRPPLKTLERFLDERLEEVFSGVHILPFFPYSSDDGFSVIDYWAVDPRLGGWEHISRLGKRCRLMIDAVLNHVSRQSGWFSGYLRDQPPYRDYFITPSPDWDLSQVVRPRTLPLLTPVETAAGLRRVWTTFSADQVDLNYANPDVLLEILSLLLFYIERGASIIRLDAIAYLWKESGTSCIHLPQTHAVIKILRAVLDVVAPQVLLVSETNVPHRENIAYFGEALPQTGRTDEAQLVYQFPLTPLVLHTFAAGDAFRLSEWAAGLESPAAFFNFLASHDGIGVLPARGLLGEAEIEALVARALAHGGHVSYKSNPDGSRSPYELNLTLYDALNDPADPDPDLDRRRFLAAQAIMLSLAGVPGVYVHSLFGSSNCQALYRQTGQPRSLNREKFSYPALSLDLDRPESRQAQILAGTLCLLRLRSGQPAFHPSAPQRVLQADPAVFALLRFPLEGLRPLICLVNVTPQPRPFGLDLDASSLPLASEWEDLISGRRWQVTGSRLEVAVDAYGILWLAPVV